MSNTDPTKTKQKTKNQCLPPLTLWVRIPLRLGVLDTPLCNKVSQWLAAGRWFSPGIPVSFNNKTDRHDITEIVLKVALSIYPYLNGWLYWITDRNEIFVYNNLFLNVYVFAKQYFDCNTSSIPRKLQSEKIRRQSDTGVKMVAIKT